MRVKTARAAALLLAAALPAFGMSPAVPAASPVPSDTYTNPLLPSGPDPWVAQRDGVYYFMNTQGDRIALRKTRDMAKLAQAPEITVWTPPHDGPGSFALWAPELHWLRGKWYLYYTASVRGQDDDSHRHVFVLENPSTDPTKGKWTSKGMLGIDKPGIDGTVFELKGQLYFVYSPYVGDHSDLVISYMTNPWTLTGPQVDIAHPTFAWEMQGGRKILEGPEFIQGPTGKLFLSYSASACWSDDYALGLLSAPAGADPMDPLVWHKSPTPVFATSVKNGVYATGHNGFFKSPDGTDWIIYHANSGPGMKCTSKRAPHMQPFHWNNDGAPDFGIPLPEGKPLPAPS